MVVLPRAAAAAALWLSMLASAAAQQGGGSSSSSSSSMLPIAIGAGMAATLTAIAALLFWRRKKNRRIRMVKAREMEQYDRAVELERATRALQRAREVLAQRTGNADWNPKLQANVQSMQLDEMADDGDADGGGGGGGAAEWRTDGPFKMGPGGMGGVDPNDPFGPDAEDTAVAVCDRAIPRVAEYGAQGAMVQVMYAAKKQLEQELRDLEHSEGIINVDGGLEEETEDPEWRERVKDQMQLKELERQLAAVDEETEDMLSEEERQRRRELEALSKEGTVEIETFPTIGHKILVRKHAPPPPRPVAWAKMATSLHRPDASEDLVQRSGQESKAVQQYSQALRAMSEEIERHDGWGEVDPKSIADVGGGGDSGGGGSPQRPVINSPDPDSAPRHEIDLMPYVTATVSRLSPCIICPACAPVLDFIVALCGTRCQQP
jgi:hypothetical protein